MIDLYRNRKHLKLLEQIPDTDEYILELDNSTLSQYTCPRRFYYYAVLGRDTYASPALTFGSHMHKGLESLHSGATLQVAQAVMVQAFEERPIQEGDYRNLQYGLDALKAYWLEYSGQIQLGAPVIAYDGKPFVEQSFSLPIFEIPVQSNFVYPKSLIVQGSEDDSPMFYVSRLHVHWSGKIDLAFERNGATWGMDHKTSSRDESSFWADFDLSAQMTGYTHVLRTLFNRHVAGMVVNTIYTRKPTKTGKGVTFERRLFNYTDEQINEWQQDVRETITQITENLVSGFFKRHTPSCVGKYGMCPYHRVCTTPKGGRDILIAMEEFYTDKVWSPRTDALAAEQPISHETAERTVQEVPFLP